MVMRRIVTRHFVKDYEGQPSLKEHSKNSATSTRTHRLRLPQQVLVRVLRCIRRLFGTLPALSCVYAVHVGNICRTVPLRLFVVAVVCGICGRDGWPEVVMVLVVLPATDIAALNRLVAELLDGVFCEVAVLLQR